MPSRHALLLAAAFLAAPALPSAAEPMKLELPGDGDPVTAMVSGKGYRFLLRAPQGWILDSQGGASRGLTTVFYRKGETFKDAPAILYANVAPRPGGEALDAFVARELARARERSPDLRAVAAAPVRTASGNTADVRTVSGDRHGNREALAFLAERESFVILVLSARSPEAFDAAMPAFRAFVQSYEPVSPDVPVVPGRGAAGPSSG